MEEEIPPTTVCTKSEDEGVKSIMQDIFSSEDLPLPEPSVIDEHESDIDSDDIENALMSFEDLPLSESSIVDEHESDSHDSASMESDLMTAEELPVSETSNKDSELVTAEDPTLVEYESDSDDSDMENELVCASTVIDNLFSDEEEEGVVNSGTDSHDDITDLPSTKEEETTMPKQATSARSRTASSAILSLYAQTKPSHMMSTSPTTTNRRTPTASVASAVTTTTPSSFDSPVLTSFNNSEDSGNDLITTQTKKLSSTPDTMQSTDSSSSSSNCSAKNDDKLLLLGMQPTRSLSSSESVTSTTDKDIVPPHTTCSCSSKKKFCILVTIILLLLTAVGAAMAILQTQFQWFSSSPISGGGDNGGPQHQEPNFDNIDALTKTPTAAPTKRNVVVPPTGSPSINPVPTKSPTTPAARTTPPTLRPTMGATTQNPSASPTKNVAAPTKAPSDAPDPATTAPTASSTTDTTTTPPLEKPPLFRPGNLISMEAGLLLSEGLRARIIATTGEPVEYEEKGRPQQRASTTAFHGRPDFGATFPDERPENSGGWIYTSNSEMEEQGKGGVGAFTFDKNGDVIDYKMVLENTTMNCGGGRSPWNTWVSCEEVEFNGTIYQVDPTGKRPAQQMTLGNEGGRWESFSYDIRDRDKPHFFATEDHSKGTVRRFTPDTVNWDDPWEILHAPGTTDYLYVVPNDERTGGTFGWTNEKGMARNNARSYYPQSEGIDVYENEMYIVCKQIMQMFIFDLDEMTYTNRTTKQGLFDGGPDQMSRLLDGDEDLLYFTEEGGRDAGIHARDEKGYFYTILESPDYADETTGLSFSPNGKHMYVAYQVNGLLFDIWREDGLAFHARTLNVKYHNQQGA